MVFHLQDRLYTECPNATHEFLGESVRERKMEAQDTQEHLAMGKNEGGLMMVSLYHLDLVIVMCLSRFTKDTWETHQRGEGMRAAFQPHNHIPRGWMWLAERFTSHPAWFIINDIACLTHNRLWGCPGLQNIRTSPHDDHQQWLYVDLHRWMS